MGRVIAVGPGGRAQAPSRDDRARPVIEHVAGNGLLGTLLLSPVCKTMDDADDLRRALYRSARYYCSCGAIYCTRKHGNAPANGKPGGCPDGGMRVSCRADVVKDTDGHLRVQFCLRDKQAGMRYVIENYGADANDWPYWAKRKIPKARKTVKAK